jgi:hypothetical protein
MKQKTIIFTLTVLFAGLILAYSISKAETETSTLTSTTSTVTSSQALVATKYKKISWVGEITALDAATKTFTFKVNPGFWGKLLGAIFQTKKTEKIYQVAVTDQTTIRYKSEQGVVKGGFENLAVGQKILTVGKWALPNTNRIEAISILVLTPWQKAKQCVHENDCEWCGAECVKKDPKRACVQIAPPEGFNCVCLNNQCTKVPVSKITPPTSTPTTSTSTPSITLPGKGKGPALTPPGLIKLSCVWCDKDCVPWSQQLRCADTMAPSGYNCIEQNGVCKKVPIGSKGQNQ